MPIRPYQGAQAPLGKLTRPLGFREFRRWSRYPFLCPLCPILCLLCPISYVLCLILCLVFPILSLLFALWDLDPYEDEVFGRLKIGLSGNGLRAPNAPPGFPEAHLASIRFSAVSRYIYTHMYMYIYIYTYMVSPSRLSTFLGVVKMGCLDAR